MMMHEEVQKLIEGVVAGGHLTQQQSAMVFEAIVTGGVEPDSVEHLLIALADRGAERNRVGSVEGGASGATVDEIVGAATVMRKHAVGVPCHFPNTIDTCGTGGDGLSTFNVSTAAAIVAAAAGAKVAKHGNRSFTRRSGSVEVLAALGVNVEASPLVVARCIREVGFGFLHAARLHPAMAQVAEIRRNIARPTIFNMLGPLTNPAGVHRQVVGVPRVEWIPKMAEALHRLGAIHAVVVRSDDGLCDFSITGVSHYTELRNDTMTPHIVRPEDVGLQRGVLDDLRVESPGESAEIIRAVLRGEQGGAMRACRDHTLFNAAAALRVAELATDLSAGVRLAGVVIDDGAARRTLEALVRVSNEPE